MLNQTRPKHFISWHQLFQLMENGNPSKLGFTTIINALLDNHTELCCIGGDLRSPEVFYMGYTKWSIILFSPGLKMVREQRTNNGWSTKPTHQQWYDIKMPKRKNTHYNSCHVLEPHTTTSGRWIPFPPLKEKNKWCSVSSQFQHQTWALFVGRTLHQRKWGFCS